MRRAYKYRAYLNKTTEAKAVEWLSTCQKLYNIALEQRIQNYKEIKKAKAEGTELPKRLTQGQQYTLLVTGQAKYKTVNSQMLSLILTRLDEAYKAFYRRTEKAGFPKFQAWDKWTSFTMSCQSGWHLDNNNFYVHNVGRFKLKLHRPIGGVIKTITIKREAGNKWYVIFSCDEVPQKFHSPTNKTVGIDMGISNFLTDSDARMVKHPRFLKTGEKKLRVLQRKLARCKKGSNHREKAKLAVAKCHAKITNQRKDFICNLAAEYTRNYDLIAIENLNIQDMVTNKYVAHDIYDAGWNLFISRLQNKGEETGCDVILIDPENTSQICSCCGAMVEKQLSVRIHKCKNCGLVVNRDINAAKNILACAEQIGDKPLDAEARLCSMSEQVLVTSV